MSNICAEKVNKTAFYDIFTLIEDHEWLKEKNKALLALWNLCDMREQQILLKELFSRFIYITRNDERETIKKIVKRIENVWNLDGSNTYISAIADSDDTDGSTAHLYSFKTFLGDSWQEENLLGSIVNIKYKLQDEFKPNLILFDDFIGSGKTFKRKIKWLINQFSELNIHLETIRIIAYAGMDFGIKDILSEIDIDIYTPNILKKGITDFETDDEVIEQKKEIMRSIENKLQKKQKGLNLNDHSLGYGGSETLYKLQDSNCSNNVFPVFWWPRLKGGIDRKTLFRRLR